MFIIFRLIYIVVKTCFKFFGILIKKKKFTSIAVEKIPNIEFGEVINDRLKNYKTLAYPEIDRKRGFEEILNSPLYKNYVISEDGKTSGIVVYLKKDERMAEYLKIKDKFTIEYVIDSVKKSNYADKIILCTTKNSQDDILCDIAKKRDIDFYRGDEHNKFKRWYWASVEFDIDEIVTADGDDLFCDPSLIDLAFKQLDSES